MTAVEEKVNKEKSKKYSGSLISAGNFEAENHFYPRVLNAHIHPLVASFFALGHKRMIGRFTHLNPQVSEEKVVEILSYSPQYFQWAGSDLFNVTSADGKRQMVIVETNSCPSGQKSMPVVDEQTNDHGGYQIVVNKAAMGCFENTDKSLGDLAVVYDKNEMEATGYANTLADETGESIWLVQFYENDANPPVKFENGVMFVRDKEDNWHSIRGCFRYVTQKPWDRFPTQTKTVVLNHIVSCLAGGRNKAMAARAYDFFNNELAGTGLSCRIPETIRNVTKNEVPLFVEQWGGHAVIKNPYSNAGQGVFTITNQAELDEFMNFDHHYDKFIVQSLVGNASWSSATREGKFFHVGTIPDKKNKTYVVDLRMMVCGDKDGFRPVACYARRARKPLVRDLNEQSRASSWEMLGTNLSVKENGEWSTESQRLLLMDRKDFNHLGIGIDDLIDAYIQTVLSVIAIDKLACKLMANGTFDYELFSALNPDDALLSEIKIGNSLK